MVRTRRDFSRSHRMAPSLPVFAPLLFAAALASAVFGGACKTATAPSVSTPAASSSPAAAAPPSDPGTPESPRERPQMQRGMPSTVPPVVLNNSSGANGQAAGLGYEAPPGSTSGGESSNIGSTVPVPTPAGRGADEAAGPVRVRPPAVRASADSGGIVGNMDTGTGMVGIGSGGGGLGLGRSAGTPPADALVDVGENLVEKPAQDGLITFGTDVDTASFQLAERLLSAGTRPPALSIRVEDFVNALRFPADGADVTEVGPLSVDAEVAASPFGEGNYLLRTVVAARPLDEGERKPVDLVLLIDGSGSMAEPDRLPLVQSLALRIAAGLRSGDTVSLIVYGDTAATRLNLADAANLQAINAAILALNAGGSTNGEAGVREAFRIVGERAAMGRNAHVLWGTDGDLNVGLTGDDLQRVIESTRALGGHLSVVGVGINNLQFSTLEEFADRGNGQFAFVGTDAQVAELASSEFLKDHEVCARDTKLQIEINQAVVRSYRLLGYENRAIADEDFRDDTQDAGEMGFGQTVNTLVEFSLLPTANVDPATPIATVHVRYLPGLRDREAREFAHVVRLGDLLGEATPSEGFMLTAAAAELAEQLRESEYARGATMAELAAFVAKLDEGSARDRLAGMVARAEVPTR